MFLILLSVSLILIYYQFDCNLRLKGTLLPILLNDNVPPMF